MTGHYTPEANHARREFVRDGGKLAPAEITHMLDHVDTLTARLAAVREIHRRGEFEDSPGDYYCTHCQTTAGIWPCSTTRALDGD